MLKLLVLPLDSVQAVWCRRSWEEDRKLLYRKRRRQKWAELCREGRTCRQIALKSGLRTVWHAPDHCTLHTRFYMVYPCTLGCIWDTLGPDHCTLYLGLYMTFFWPMHSVYQIYITYFCPLHTVPWAIYDMLLTTAHCTELTRHSPDHCTVSTL